MLTNYKFMVYYFCKELEIATSLRILCYPYEDEENYKQNQLGVQH